VDRVYLRCANQRCRNHPMITGTLGTGPGTFILRER
jgi:hypothetical protein